MFCQLDMVDKEQSAMGNITTIQQVASEGLHQIEDAISRLLSNNPQGLRNSEIAEMLNPNPPMDRDGRREDSGRG